jgi:hypothetical protein
MLEGLSQKIQEKLNKAFPGPLAKTRPEQLTLPEEQELDSNMDKLKATVFKDTRTGEGPAALQKAQQLEIAINAKLKEKRSPENDQEIAQLRRQLREQKLILRKDVKVFEEQSIDELMDQLGTLIEERMPLANKVSALKIVIEGAVTSGMSGRSIDVTRAQQDLPKFQKELQDKDIALANFLVKAKLIPTNSANLAQIFIREYALVTPANLDRYEKNPEAYPYILADARATKITETRKQISQAEVTAALDEKKGGSEKDRLLEVLTTMGPNINRITMGKPTELSAVFPEGTVKIISEILSSSDGNGDAAAVVALLLLRRGFKHQEILSQLKEPALAVLSKLKESNAIDAVMKNGLNTLKPGLGDSVITINVLGNMLVSGTIVKEFLDEIEGRLATLKNARQTKEAAKRNFETDRQNEFADLVRDLTGLKLNTADETKAGSRVSDIIQAILDKDYGYALVVALSGAKETLILQNKDKIVDFSADFTSFIDSIMLSSPEEQRASMPTLAAALEYGLPIEMLNGIRTEVLNKCYELKNPGKSDMTSPNEFASGFAKIKSEIDKREAKKNQEMQAWLDQAANLKDWVELPLDKIPEAAAKFILAIRDLDQGKLIQLVQFVERHRAKTIQDIGMQFVAAEQLAEMLVLVRDAQIQLVETDGVMKGRLNLARLAYDVLAQRDDFDFSQSQKWSQILRSLESQVVVPEVNKQFEVIKQQVSALKDIFRPLVKEYLLTEEIIIHAILGHLQHPGVRDFQSQVRSSLSERLQQVRKGYGEQKLLPITKQELYPFLTAGTIGLSGKRLLDKIDQNVNSAVEKAKALYLPGNMDEAMLAAKQVLSDAKLGFLDQQNPQGFASILRTLDMACDAIIKEEARKTSGQNGGVEVGKSFMAKMTSFSFPENANYLELVRGRGRFLHTYIDLKSVGTQLLEENGFNSVGITEDEQAYGDFEQRRRLVDKQRTDLTTTVKDLAIRTKKDFVINYITKKWNAEFPDKILDPKFTVAIANSVVDKNRVNTDEVLIPETVQNFANQVIAAWSV